MSPYDVNRPRDESDIMEAFVRRGAGAQRAVDDQGAGDVARAGWKVRRVDEAELVLVVEDRLSHQKPRPLVELKLQRVEGETTIELKGNRFIVLPAAAAAYVAAWMSAPFTGRLPP